MGAMLAQEDDQSVENAVYYLSKKFLAYENNYSPLEKTCLALVWATKKLRHYMLAHTTHVLSKEDQLKYLFGKPALRGRLARWTVLLSKFDLKFINNKVIKGSAVSDHLATHPVSSEEENYDLPDESIMKVEVDIRKYTLTAHRT